MLCKAEPRPIFRIHMQDIVVRRRRSELQLISSALLHPLSEPNHLRIRRHQSAQLLHLRGMFVQRQFCLQ